MSITRVEGLRTDAVQMLCICTASASRGKLVICDIGLYEKHVIRIHEEALLQGLGTRGVSSHDLLSYCVSSASDTHAVCAAFVFLHSRPSQM